LTRRSRLQFLAFVDLHGGVTVRHRCAFTPTGFGERPSPGVRSTWNRAFGRLIEQKSKPPLHLGGHNLIDQKLVLSRPHISAMGQCWSPPAPVLPSTTCGGSPSWGSACIVHGSTAFDDKEGLGAFYSNPSGLELVVKAAVFRLGLSDAARKSSQAAVAAVESAREVTCRSAH